MRITPTLLICVAGAAVAGGLLALPASDDDAPAGRRSPSPPTDRRPKPAP